MTAMESDEHLCMLFSYDGGTTYATATTKFRKWDTGLTTTADPVPHLGALAWTDMSANGVINGSEMDYGWNTFEIDIPLDGDHDLTNFVALIGCDAERTYRGFGVNAIRVIDTHQRGMQIYRAENKIIHETYSGLMDIEWKTKRYLREGDTRTWMAHDGSLASTVFTGNSWDSGAEGVVQIVNENTNMTGGEVTLRVQNNDTTNENQNYFIAFYTGDSYVGGIDTEVVYDPFTGGHPTSIDGRKIGSIIKGMILKSTGDVFFRGEGISNAWVTTEASTQAKDKAVVGVYNKLSAWGSGDIPSPTGKQLHMYNAIGEGQILVTDEGGDIETGDYICSSNRKGHGMKQDDDILHNYTAAKATEPINWDDIEVDEDFGFKSKLIACTYHCG